MINKTYKLDKRREKVLILFNDGLNIIEIAEKLGVSTSTISRDLKLLNKTPIGRIDYTSNTIDIDTQLNICELYQKGKSYSDIKRELNVNTTAIKGALVRHNIPVRSRKEANSLKWDNPEFRNNQVHKRMNKPSGALNKSWKLNHIKKSPNIKGENNPNWKGGKTKLSQQIRTSAEYSFWRMQVFKRDFFTCQHCGSKNKKGEKYIFDADHIYPFSKILDDFNITSIEEAISCDKFWDIDNGRTLCRSCHMKTDTWGVNINKNV